MKGKKGAGPVDIIFIMAIFMMLAITGLLCHYIYGEFMVEIEEKFNESYTNEDMSLAFSRGVDTFNNMDYLLFGVFAGLVIAMLVTAFLVNVHPIFFPLFIFIMLIAVLISVPLSNVWITISTNPVFSNNITYFSLTNHLMCNLPYYVTVFGFIGIIVLYAKTRSQNEFVA